ncbi:MAG TPA: thiol:disulfide interchange protein DsbA/DsbL [Cellvibrionaceae bacterium]
MRVLAVIAAMLFSLAACADSDSAPKYEAGKHYQVLPEAVRTDDASKIEVREVFAYTCNHCFRFESVFAPWIKKQADDVNVVKTPVVWAAQMEQYARAYYTAQSLGIIDEAHMDIFTTIHVQRHQFRGVEDWAEFFAQYGAEKDRVTATFESFGVNSQLKQADARVRAYGITGTPELIVDGRYRISASDAGSHENMLKVADFLIEQIRAEQ